jgi:glucokinase
VILGVERRDNAIAAVLTDGHGGIAKRGTRDGSDAASAVEIVREVVSGTDVTAAGVAVSDPLDDTVADLIAAVSSAMDAAVRPRVISRGGAVALAEHWHGAAIGWRVVAALVAADQVHSGFVVEGRLFEGAHGAAGAAAWLALNPVEREDYRRVGCLGAEIARPGIVRRLVWRIKSGDESRALEIAGGDLAAITVNHLFDAARAGDGVAISVVRDTARYVGMAIANIVALIDPDIVVLGGVLADATDLLLQASHMEAQRRLPEGMVNRVRVVPAILGDDGGPLGAARVAMQLVP